MLKKIGSAEARNVRDMREMRDAGKSNFHLVSPVPSVSRTNIVFPRPARRCFMPMYDYKCLDCGKESLVVLTLKEHESSKVKCPKCGSTKIQQLYSSFVAHTTKKS
jgi:putative FmdB family regulatory protein